MLISPLQSEARAALWIVQSFGRALGLHSNLAKSSLSSIRCAGLNLQPILDIWDCPIRHFPIQYLGLPLSLTRLAMGALQPLLDKVAGHVPTWKASLLEKSGRTILIDSTLTATAVYHMLSLDLPPWFFEAMNKLLRGFF